jgi:hypothetical protein
VLDLPRFERDAETFLRALNRQHYLHGAGLQPTLDLTTLYDDFTYLFREETFGELEEAQVEPKPKRYLADFVATGFLEDRAKALTERLAAAEAAATVVWDDRALPYRSVPAAIANEPDAHHRHDLDARYRATLATFNPLYEERHRTLLESAPALDAGDYIALNDSLKELGLADLTEAMERFLEVTEQAYFGALEELLGTIGLAPTDAARCDLARLFRAPHLDTAFPARDLVPTLYRALRELDLDLRDQTSIHLDTEARPMKSPRAFCAPLAIPTDVRLVIRPLGGREDYSALFHEAGHAEHYANVDRSLDFPFRWLGDNSVTESHAFLLEHLLSDAGWLERVLSREYPVDYLRLAFFERLMMLRRYATKLLYERELHRGEDYERLASRYAELFTRNLGVEYGPEAYLADVDDGLYSAVYLRAWIFEAQHRRYLQREYDEEWYRVPRAGRFLRDLWREGQKYSVDELARFMGYDGLDLRPLTEELLAGVA